jgi:hypothetical protein
MNKFSNLKKLFNEIELLESAGLYKAANVLHKKFVKEAQEYPKKPAQELMNELFLVAQNPGNQYGDLKSVYQSKRGEYSSEEQTYIDAAIARADKQRQNLGTFSTVVNPQNPTVSTQAPATATSGQLSSQVQAEQADIAFKGLGNAIQTGKENMNIQAKYRMTPQENAAENQLYSSTINEIKKLLATGNETQRNYARGLYQETRTKFKNLKRQSLFDQQYSAIERNPNKKQ